MSKRITVGSKIKLTEKFLRSTGQLTGSAGMDCWIVQSCLCKQCIKGDWVCTNERALTDMYTAAELEAEPYLAFRHIALVNLHAC